MPGANSVLFKVKADGNDHDESSSGGTSSIGDATKKVRSSAASKAQKELLEMIVSRVSFYNLNNAFAPMWFFKLSPLEFGMFFFSF